MQVEIEKITKKNQYEWWLRVDGSSQRPFRKPLVKNNITS